MNRNRFDAVVNQQILELIGIALGVDKDERETVALWRIRVPFLQNSHTYSNFCVIDCIWIDVDVRSARDLLIETKLVVE